MKIAAVISAPLEAGESMPSIARTWIKKTNYNIIKLTRSFKIAEYLLYELQ